MMISEKISISAYELGDHKTYKIQFNEYVSGVIVFQYGSL